jgi:DNA polymerase-3 subunit epsilon
VARLLGLPSSDVDDALQEVSSDGSEPAAVDTLPTAGIELAPGDRVVFTGEMLRERTEWEGLARAQGLQPGGVTKATKLVVAGNTATLSGKAAKARSYGIPIVSEASFERLLNHLQTRGPSFKVVA